MADPIFIGELIDKILDSNVRIPSFQREFGWDAVGLHTSLTRFTKGSPSERCSGGRKPPGSQKGISDADSVPR